MQVNVVEIPERAFITAPNLRSVQVTACNRLLYEWEQPKEIHFVDIASGQIVKQWHLPWDAEYCVDPVGEQVVYSTKTNNKDVWWTHDEPLLLLQANVRAVRSLKENQWITINPDNSVDRICSTIPPLYHRWPQLRAAPDFCSKPAIHCADEFIFIIRRPDELEILTDDGLLGVIRLPGMDLSAGVVDVQEHICYYGAPQKESGSFTIMSIDLRNQFKIVNTRQVDVQHPIALYVSNDYMRLDCWKKKTDAITE